MLILAVQCISFVQGQHMSSLLHLTICTLLNLDSLYCIVYIALYTVQGQFRFQCPALKNGTVTKCNAVWSYSEVRRLAVLSPEEMQHFEEKMAPLAAARYCEFKAVSDLGCVKWCKVHLTGHLHGCNVPFLPIHFTVLLSIGSNLKDCSQSKLG